MTKPRNVIYATELRRAPGTGYVSELRFKIIMVGKLQFGGYEPYEVVLGCGHNQRRRSRPAGYEYQRGVRCTSDHSKNIVRMLVPGSSIQTFVVDMAKENADERLAAVTE